MDIYVYLCIFLLSLIAIHVLNQKKRKVPPGLPILPLVGSVPWVMYWGKDFLPYINRKRFGNMVGTKSGNIDIVYINDPATLKEMTNMDECSSRHSGSVKTSGMKSWGEPMGLIDPDYTDAWKEQKRFVLRNLRDYGFGRKSEENVLEEANQLVEHITNSISPSEDYFIKDNFNISVANVIWRMVASKTYPLDTDEGKRLIDLMDMLFTKTNPAYLQIPVLGVMLGKQFLKRKRNMFKDMQDIFLECIEEHEATLDENHLRDLIDTYLMAIKEGKEGFHKKQLAIIILDLFAAGSETTSTTLRWSILFLIHHPEVQARCQEEIEKLAKGENPNLTDMTTLLYCQATISEVLRVGSTVPRTLTHRATSNVVLGGHPIKKGTFLYGNLASINSDPDLWERPEEFQPERFLTDDGKALRDFSYFTPFSLGKRVCLGETLAKVELFIFFTSLFRNFTFSAPENHPMPDPDKFHSAITKIPDGYYCKVTPRVK